MSRVPPDSLDGQFLASPSSSAADPPGEEGVEELGTPTLLAIRTDGAVLLSVEEFSDRDFTGRTLWTAVVLTPNESSYVHQRGLNAAYEVAAKLSATFPRKGKAAAPAPEGGGEVVRSPDVASPAESPPGAAEGGGSRERGGT